MKLIIAALAFACLTGCGLPPDLPIVDLDEKDPVQTNRDMALCQAITSGTFAWGNPIATCMVGKGYTLMGTYRSYNKYEPKTPDPNYIPTSNRTRRRDVRS